LTWLARSHIRRCSFSLFLESCMASMEISKPVWRSRYRDHGAVEGVSVRCTDASAMLIASPQHSGRLIAPSGLNSSGSEEQAHKMRPSMAVAHLFFVDRLRYCRRIGIEGSAFAATSTFCVALPHRDADRRERSDRPQGDVVLYRGFEASMLRCDVVVPRQQKRGREVPGSIGVKRPDLSGAQVSDRTSLQRSQLRWGR